MMREEDSGGPVPDGDIRPLIAQEIPSLRRYARALTGDAARADDLVQDSLERALRKHNLWLRRGPLRAWLFRILYRTFLDGRKRKRETATHLPIEETATPAAEAPRQSAQTHCREVIAALEQLPDDQRAALTLIALEEFEYSDAAKALDIPVGTLRSRLARGRRNLRHLVEPEILEDAEPQNPPAAAPERTYLRRVK